MKTTNILLISLYLNIVFMRSKIPLWADPDNWDGHNAATPDLEAIPCATDTVHFPDTSLSVEMPDVAPKVAALNIFGMEYEGRDFAELVARDVGRATFFTASRTSLPELHITSRHCDDPSGCECDNEHLRSAVCRSVATHCAPALCLQPVTPSGNCCPICGGYALFKYSASFNLEKFRKLLAEKFKNTDVNVFASKNNGLIQVVIVERGEYEGKVDDYVKDLRETVINYKNLGLEFVEEFAAGPYAAPASFTGVIRLIIGLLFLALLAFALIFCVHTEDCKVNTSGQRQYLFAVFENQGEEVELCKPEEEEPVVPPRRSRQAFDNPMYGATAQEARDEDDYQENSDYQSSLEESNPIYATMESVDLLGENDVTQEEQALNGNKYQLTN